jgi:hypothetical protein
MGRINAISAGAAGVPPDPAGPREPWRRTLEGPVGEWTFIYVVTEAVPRSAGGRGPVPGHEPLRVRGAAPPARYREYCDTGAGWLQFGFVPESLAKVRAKRI